MSRRFASVALLALAAVAAIGVWAGRQPHERELLRAVYSPTFGNVPPEAPLGTTLTTLRGELTSAEGQDFLSRLLPDQAGVLWIAVIVALAIGFDFSRLRTA